MPSSKPTTPHWRCDGVPRCQEQCGLCQTAEIMQPLLNAAPQEKGRIDDSTTALSVASPADAAPSDTPRTDAEIEKNSDLKGIRFVTIAFARQLERELAAAPDLLAACEKALYALKGRLLDQIDQAVTDIESAWREQMMTGTVLFANDDDTLQYDAKERIKKAVVALRSTASEIAPNAARMAIRVLLNHVEPGWENSKSVVQAWLDGQLESATSAIAPKHAVTQQMYEAGLRYVTGRGTAWCVTDLYLAMEDERVSTE